MIKIAKGVGVRLSPDNSIFVAIQCGCGWTVIAWDQNGYESHHDLYDAAERELRTHLDASETDACRTWLK